METFVVRVWHPAEGEGGAAESSLRGVIERAGEAEVRPFRNEVELLAALRAAPRATARREGARDE